MTDSMVMGLDADHYLASSEVEELQMLAVEETRVNYRDTQTGYRRYLGKFGTSLNLRLVALFILVALIPMVTIAILSIQKASDALNQAWGRHWQEWVAGVSTDAIDIARWSLEAFGIEERELAERLGREMQEVALEQVVIALEGAGETLERLAQRDVRRALICDTGFTPGHVVRQLLEREGLLEYLEVQIFSDEAGVPKPNPRIFHAALDQLKVAPRHALHVGDLRRSDIAGARAVGMGSVRIRWQHDDPSELPDAEQVADSHAHLQEILGLHEDEDQDTDYPPRRGPRPGWPRPRRS